MSFLHPGYLWLLLLVPFVWVYPRGNRETRHTLLRSLVLVLLILGLGRPVRVADEAPQHHVFVVDLSASAVNSTALADFAARLGPVIVVAEELPEEYRTSLVAIGEVDASLETRLNGHFDDVVVIGRDGTSSISRALECALEAIPDGAPAAVTLVSDGLATDRRWGASVQTLERSGIPVFTFEVASAQADVRPVSLEVLQPLRVGHTARLRAEILGHDVTCDVRLVGPEGELARHEGLEVRERGLAVLEFEPDSAGFLPVELEVVVTSGENTNESNDRLRRTLAVDDAQRVLYLGERIVEGGERLGELIGHGFDLTLWDGAPLTRAQLAAFDLAVLDDLPVERLEMASQVELAAAVERDGLGLFMSGGAGAFGPGGYHNTPIEELLPVEFVQKEEKRDPSTTLVVIIDTSGSMGGNRVQLAKEVARLSMRRLLPHDKVGIVEFYGAKRWAAPIQPASNSIEIERALNRLDAGGGTVILPAIEEAYYGLKNVQTRYKHVLILTDGGVETGAFEPLLRNMAKDGINVSSVLIGAQAHSEFLVTLANWGKGRFYSVPNRFNLPEILLKQPASAKLPAYRPGAHVVEARGGASWWGDVDLEGFPDLAGYVETRNRSGSQVLLETAEGAHPLLASWRYGLGRVTAFTSEPTGPGTQPWREWDEFGAWMARVLERTSSDQNEIFRYEIERQGSNVTVSALRRSGNLAPAAQRLHEGQAGTPLVFRRRAPDRFEARFFVDPATEVRVLAENHVGLAISRTRLVSIAHADEAPELQVDPRRGLDLAALAAATGGRHAPLEGLAGFTPSVGGGKTPLALDRLWPWLVLLALLVYLGELYYRRRPALRVRR